MSPEALAAAAAFRHAEPNVDALLKRTSSGRELIERHGWIDDVTTAAMLDEDDCVRVLDGLESIHVHWPGADTRCRHPVQTSGADIRQGRAALEDVRQD